ncbi:GalNAc-alpha-(1-_4)-GalNAc-alpha-(1-_3)-diNAcBac-PP-undecaprenol alpha-1,4-N-acetyl-D-galactosaminyltransferase [Providencia manganoxydans]|uniref:glycosyltransferase n=1 Tax=Providencia TaxID=586 RepID=UPI00111E89E2|nr:glycosyltransferase [Providencia stuartii]
MKSINFLIDDITNSGGTERVTCTLSNQLVNLGYNVNIFSIKKEKEKINYNINTNVNIIFNNRNKYFFILDVLRKTNNDKSTLIVVSMGKLSVQVSLLSIINKTNNLIFSEHISFESFSLFKKIIKRTSYFFADKVVLLTEHDKNILSNHDKNKKFITIKNINPFYQFDISDFNTRPNVALAIGRLSYQKNFERLIDIWKKSTHPNWSLIIIGDGEEYQKIANLISNDIDITLVKNSSQLEDYYNNAKIFLMTSRFEGLPMVLIEAQHFGIPSLSFDCKTGPSEIIINNETGYIIPYNDDELFKSKLSKLAADRLTLSEMHSNSLNSIHNFSPNEILKKWISII